ncbi:hypothetical protein DPEC_G00156090 [Dallia pectoralis]|uniref:Uncharacterized protein n=1 Tax=Dallia pectoralis TaxID=75939 RepID=A0ACC2GKN0_DALPE|nr:hypothetical protein DPEC_G00156090 [Dallia pectoralis]
MQKVALVTGSNKGIGFAVVQSLCKQYDGDVYLSSRDVGRGTAAVEKLKSEGLKAFFRQLDINHLESVRAARDFFKEKYGGVDVLINNAGIAFKVSDTTPFGTQAEVTLKTNFFATRDICDEFLPIIKSGGRVVNVSSMMGSIALNRCSPELQARFRSSDITQEELVGLMERIYARKLRQERPADRILLNACCPGWVRTDMAGPNATKSPDEGAITPVYLALLPAGAEEPHGQFVSDKEVQPCPATITTSRHWASPLAATGHHHQPPLGITTSHHWNPQSLQAHYCSFPSHYMGKEFVCCYF